MTTLSEPPLGKTKADIERDFEPVVRALEPILYDLPGKIVAIDGLPGVGKTPLGRFLAWRFNVSLIETDLFLHEGLGVLRYRNDEIARIIDQRLQRPRPVIIEGVAILRLLALLKRRPDFLIYVTNKDAPETLNLSGELAEYEAKFHPRLRANIALTLED